MVELMVGWVIRFIPHGRLNELFLILVGATKALSCLWDVHTKDLLPIEKSI